LVVFGRLDPQSPAPPASAERELFVVAGLFTVVGRGTDASSAIDGARAFVADVVLAVAYPAR
jgi:hypothetical protein